MNPRPSLSSLLSFCSVHYSSPWYTATYIQNEVFHLTSTELGAELGKELAKRKKKKPLQKCIEVWFHGYFKFHQVDSQKSAFRKNYGSI